MDTGTQNAIDALIKAGYPIRYTSDDAGEAMGYLGSLNLRHYRSEDYPRAYVDLGGLARSEDMYSQSDTTMRSNYRRLHEDYPDTFTDVRYDNVNTLGAFVDNLTWELVQILVSLAEYPLYDEEDDSALRNEEISESVGEYLIADIKDELSDEARDQLDELTPDQQDHLIFTLCEQYNYYPEHDGVDVRWDYAKVAEMMEAHFAE